MVAPTQKFVYDALYRLIEAKGRELIGTADFGAEDNWNDAAWQTNYKGDGNAVQNYTQKYTYDAVGNILSLQHIANTGSYARTYNYDSNSNKLLSTEVSSSTYSYSHDSRGNMTEMPHLSEMNWNTQNELSSITRGSEPTYYQYSNGERVRKFTDKGNIKEERIYLGNFEVYRTFDNGSLKVERTTVHVSDDTGRIAMLEKRTFGSAVDDNDTAEELIRYVYSNHLQSASLELDETGAIISYEEYHPYGTTSYQTMNALIKAVAKRYRYTGKERDEESGLYYHGARYYIPWLCRWVSVDPLESKYAGMSSYNYCINNPLKFIDPDGKEVQRDSQEVFDQLKEKVIDRVQSLTNELNELVSTATNRKGKVRFNEGQKIEKKLLEYRINKLSEVLTDMMLIEENEKFSFKFIGIEKNGDNNFVDIKPKVEDVERNIYEISYFLDDIPHQIHEIVKHAVQITKGDLIYKIIDNEIKAIDKEDLSGINLEVEAYQAQYSYEGELNVFIAPPEGSIIEILNKQQNISGTDKQLNEELKITDPKQINSSLLKNMMENTNGVKRMYNYK